MKKFIILIAMCIIGCGNSNPASSGNTDIVTPPNKNGTYVMSYTILNTTPVQYIYSIMEFTTTSSKTYYSSDGITKGYLQSEATGELTAPNIYHQVNYDSSGKKVSEYEMKKIR